MSTLPQDSPAPALRPIPIPYILGGTLVSTLPCYSPPQSLCGTPLSPLS